jgi:replication factor C subunit 1
LAICLHNCQDLNTFTKANFQIISGAENCLEGLTFVITGVLESLEREEATDVIKKYGGKVTTNVSKKTSYIVIGEEAGESKLAKVRSFAVDQSIQQMHDIV